MCVCVCVRQCTGLRFKNLEERALCGTQRTTRVCNWFSPSNSTWPSSGQIHPPQTLRKSSFCWLFNYCHQIAYYFGGGGGCGVVVWFRSIFFSLYWDWRLLKHSVQKTDDPPPPSVRSSSPTLPSHGGTDPPRGVCRSLQNEKFKYLQNQWATGLCMQVR